MSLKTAPIVALVILFGSVFSAAQSIPKDLWGKWKIVRIIRTRTISCWGESDAKQILGTEIEYSEKSFRWKHSMTTDPLVEDRVVTADQFRDENSSPSTNGSQADFQQLGIRANHVREISIDHEPGNITHATVEIPGDSLLVKDPNTIVFSVCNIYLEAKRIHPRK